VADSSPDTLISNRRIRKLEESAALVAIQHSTGISIGVKSIAEELRSLMLVSQCPAGFFALFSLLERQRKLSQLPIMEHAEFVHIAGLCNLMHHSEVNLAIKLMTTCGYLLQYNELALKNIFFDPQWLALLFRRYASNYHHYHHYHHSYLQSGRLTRTVVRVRLYLIPASFHPIQRILSFQKAESCHNINYNNCCVLQCSHPNNTAA
jgi:hypothetical protein